MTTTCGVRYCCPWCPLCIFTSQGSPDTPALSSPVCVYFVGLHILNVCTLCTYHCQSRIPSPDKMTCYWEVKVEAFTGVRLEIGVATRRSIYRGGCNKEEVCTVCTIPWLWQRANAC